MTRRLLQQIARWLITVMVVAQFATAAYACSGMGVTSDAQSAEPVAKTQVATERMVAATSNNFAPPVAQADAGPVGQALDAQFGNLCAEHCHQGHQGDHPVLPGLPAVVLSALYATPALPVPQIARRPAAATVSALVAASASLAVRHCCFRI